MCVLTRLMTSILLFSALMYALDVCMIYSLQMHACMSGMHMPNFDCMHFGVHPSLYVAMLNNYCLMSTGVLFKPSEHWPAAGTWLAS